MKYVFFSILYKYITPFFMFNESFFLLINFIIIILSILSIVIYKYIDRYSLLIILLNVLFETSFDRFFLILQNPFLMFSTKLFQFILSIYLNEVVYSNKKSANLLIPYIFWNFILTLLTIIILFLNT